MAERLEEAAELLRQMADRGFVLSALRVKVGLVMRTLLSSLSLSMSPRPLVNLLQKNSTGDRPSF
ncbi:hypothetical protein [Synechococcus elongatus]|uniref:hypothetical protein n=1 Tax=Synechococcus elongatus TaxID=32046 RepID=UPI0030CC92DA